MPARSPVITGTGMISAAGGTRLEVWDSIRAGKSGLGPLTLFPSSRYGSHLVGQIRQDVDRLTVGVRGSRTDKLAWLAAAEALRCAFPDAAGGNTLRNLLKSGAPPPERRGVMLGSTVGGMLGTEEFVRRLLRDQKRRFGVLRFHECAGATERCADLIGARGPCGTVSTACSAGAQAIALAGRMIAEGEADFVLAGGSDSLSRLTLNGFGSLLLLDPTGCRPFDARRAGISLGEGAGMLVLEAEETALARGARVLARLAGWGASCDAHHATAPHPEGRGALSAMQRALDHAGLTPAQISFVSAHGTGTPDNDSMEAKALRLLFEDHLPPVGSVMRFFGHTLAASGALKAVLCVQALQEQHIPASLGCEEPDPTLNLQPVRHFEARNLSHLLSNSFGFGGNNVALIFSRAETAGGSADLPADPCKAADVPVLFSPTRIIRSSGEVSRRERQTTLSTSQAARSVSTPHRFAVVGAGVVSAAGNSLAEVFAAFQKDEASPALFEMPQGSPPARIRACACADFGAERLIAAAKLRRMSRFQQMALVAAMQSVSAEMLASVPSDRVCVSIGTGLGALIDTAAFVENLVLKDERAPRPACFTNSVHNALASQVALEWGFTGMNSTSVHREICFEASLWQGAGELVSRGADLALVGAADELSPYTLAAGLRWGWWTDATTQATSPASKPPLAPRLIPGEGATVFALARDTTFAPALAWVSGIHMGYGTQLRNGELDADREALWIRDTLAQDGETMADLDLILTGANGWEPLDRAYEEVAKALARLADREIPVASYKPWCGEHHSASGFGFLTAIGLVRGEIPITHCGIGGNLAASAGRPCRKVLLYTLAPSGAKAMCCVWPERIPDPPS